MNPANWGKREARSDGVTIEQLQRAYGRWTNAGISITKQLAFQNATFRACILRPSSDLASLSFPVLDYETRAKQPDHQVHRLLNKRPNALQSPMVWRQKMFIDAMVEGNGLSRIVRSNRFSKITDLVPLNPCATKIEPSGAEFVYKTKLNGEDLELKPFEVLHLMNPSNNGYWGRGALDELREILGLAIACDQFAQRYFSQANVVDWWSTDQILSQDDADLLANEMNKNATGTDNAHKAKIAHGGLKPLALNHTPEGSQLLTTRQFNAEEICRALQIPPPIAGLLTRATWNNIEHLSIDYVEHLRVYAVQFEQEINRKLFLESEQDTYFAELNLESLKRADQSTRYKNYDIAIKGGWLTPKHAAKIENLPTEGLQDEPNVPMNVQPVSEVIAVKEDKSSFTVEDKSIDKDQLVRRAIRQFATKEWKSLDSAVRKGVSPTDWAGFYDDKMHLLAENLSGILPDAEVNRVVSKYWQYAARQLDDAAAFGAIPELIEEIKQREDKWNWNEE